ncbi:magnesium transporter CorA family protein [[Clostridium] polysaccharolyticum]|uniref:Magnesium transporter n=1 Tax=[Clostridium] polysaccharolyticum TaxID=29364 RepID=A0A1I0B2A0_9FIRM|nr:magnesium transporter CorA family protein [[Clostridium] polysaccharolyticum]SET00793.1 magnesium transporter [[Clostridium] polysaccharolyticum]
MIGIFKTFDDGLKQIKDYEDGCWVALTSPSPTELLEVSEQFEVDIDHLRAPLDEEERSRLEIEDDYSLVLVDIPCVEEKNGRERYVTMPLGVVLVKNAIITVCLEETPILKSFMEGRVRGFYTFKKTRFILQILYKNASVYLQYLKIIDRKSGEIEEKLHISTKNRELIELLELEKCLVYFTTSLRSNEVVLEKLLRTESIKQYPEDKELLEDVIIENKQAIEMANIYSGILSGMMDAFASVISNNLNIIMKTLATITIVMSIPTMIFSMYGMNFTHIPLGDFKYGFLIIILITLLLTVFVARLFAKKDMF